MKTRTLLLVLILVAFAAGAGWWFGRQGHAPAASSASTERKIRFYQCSMHPQVKSDQPGKCTICGMDLSPIFEGQKEVAEDVVALSPGTIQVVNVQTERVRKEALKRVLRVSGTIDDDDTKHRIISAYIDGRIEQLFVNFTGAEVTQGEPLATFYSPGLLTAEREYLLLKQRKPTNSNSNLEAEHRRLLEAAGQRLRRLGLTEQQVESIGKDSNSIARSTITAPMTGTVVSRAVYEGQYVKEGEKLFEIADFATMWFKFDAYEQDLASLRIGQTVEVTTPSAPGRVLKGKISFIDPNVNDPTRSAKVRVELPNPFTEENGQKRRLLLHRVYAEGGIQLEFPETLVVPRTAVLNPGGTPLVYVDIGDNSYQQRQVKLGLRGTDTWQVLDGLNDGEKVVTYGNTLIDAQAQLNQGAQPAGDPHQHEAQAKEIGDLEEIGPQQLSSAQDLLQVASELAGNLAADNAAAYNVTVAKFGPKVATFTNEWSQLKSWSLLVEPIQQHARLAPAKDLADARKAFFAFSTAFVEFTKHLRVQRPELAVKIYRCPMVNQAVPGAPKNGFWVQQSEPLRNPFFGSEMLECGTEVKP